MNTIGKMCVMSSLDYEIHDVIKYLDDCLELVGTPCYIYYKSNEGTCFFELRNQDGNTIASCSCVLLPSITTPTSTEYILSWQQFTNISLKPEAANLLKDYLSNNPLIINMYTLMGSSEAPFENFKSLLKEYCSDYAEKLHVFIYATIVLHYEETLKALKQGIQEVLYD